MTLIEQLAQFELKMIQFDGVQQSYREAGTGKVLVLLHGISSGSGSWVKQLQDLSHHFHVIAWDAPGYGQSDRLVTKPNAADYAKRLKGMLDALDLNLGSGQGQEQIILVGHSLGAMQAAAFNALYPDAVEALVIANVAQGYKGSDAQKQQDVFEKRPKMLQTLGASGMAQSRGPHLVANASAEALALIEAVMHNIHLDGFSDASYLLAYDAIQSYLNPEQHNIHVIKGMADGITPPQDIQALADQFQLKPCYDIAAAGHLSYLDQAEQFNQILLSLN
ncbi:alpha/beta fold hydrolase [Acinetobacter sp. ANC 3813]|uniref:alpha/beta fold hydrolase n=1 Tax=Acinetobacter sp. ANC 3813 TaxID=1977873 RepID=UPI000A34B42A|nr:alpha/beta hydrolase [Acinetobacter sp. ANC 3813]OTG92124.1 alpha/beta hydrolase [Acinetobacter sp. ANC 3813]